MDQDEIQWLICARVFPSLKFKTWPSNSSQSVQ